MIISIKHSLKHQITQGVFYHCATLLAVLLKKQSIADWSTDCNVAYLTDNIFIEMRRCMLSKS